MYFVQAQRRGRTRCVTDALLLFPHVTSEWGNELPIRIKDQAIDQREEGKLPLCMLNMLPITQA
jgi:hypothetical protein